ncbi:M20/M25/M40 family metallo-hydrolase [Nocardioides sp. LMS-CY]|uniref:M20/M25/M40 family metallo-hydrolase n=1 Tax=Nocardioides sp. (strain LMS-CY) TaxID=2840457 RepID=UPI001C005221|nr:M20/M25/M40 family metallo-hydrolase [Nocardioides sp. LMS-CY]QWF22767.1 M20/M25/M40 family metallo-hydrolase [Nocardioides sp. LMS-CY]
MSAPLDAAVGRVMRRVADEDLLAAITGLVDVASPTGAEGELASWIAARLFGDRIESKVQWIDGLQANAVAVLRGSGTGASTLLYAPLDTFTTGDPTRDVPGAARRMRPDMLPRAVVRGDLVQGLGAGNPKGHAACVLVAFEALAASGVELAGDVVAGFGAGGMPTFAPEGIGTPGRANTGHGVGAGFLAERGFTTDHAVIAKPGWSVSHEEVGLAWLDIVVPGEHTYVGSRHRMPYRNAVALAGVVANRLEDWFAEYAVRHEHDTMRPQGVVSSVEGGLGHLAASTPATVRLRADVRLTTRQTPATVTREVREFVTALGRELEAELRVDQIAGIPASRTDPDAPVIRAAVAAWEAVAGVPHQPIRENSGATDANILRMRGIPTARVGMPKVPAGSDGESVDFTLGMNLVDVREARRLVEVLVRTVLVLDGHDAREAG